MTDRNFDRTGPRLVSLEKAGSCVRFLNGAEQGRSYEPPVRVEECSSNKGGLVTTADKARMVCLE